MISLMHVHDSLVGVHGSDIFRIPAYVRLVQLLHA